MTKILENLNYAIVAGMVLVVVVAFLVPAIAG
jgi:type II secretory pathway component PulF